jgi:hypothetical protein
MPPGHIELSADVPGVTKYARTWWLLASGWHDGFPGTSYDGQGLTCGDLEARLPRWLRFPGSRPVVWC